MNRTQLAASLHQIRALASECLKSLGEKPAKPARQHKHEENDSKANTLPHRILQLRDNGFFTQSKTVLETHAKLSPTYSCEPDRVSMALLRLKERRKLRKTSKALKGKKQAAYVW